MFVFKGFRSFSELVGGSRRPGAGLAAQPGESRWHRRGLGSGFELSVAKTATGAPLPRSWPSISFQGGPTDPLFGGRQERQGKEDVREVKRDETESGEEAEEVGRE